MIVSYSLQLEFLSQAVTISDLFRVDGNVYFYGRGEKNGHAVRSVKIHHQPAAR